MGWELPELFEKASLKKFCQPSKEIATKLSHGPRYLNYKGLKIRTYVLGVPKFVFGQTTVVFG